MTRYYNSSPNTHRFVSVSQHLFKIFRLTFFLLIAFVASSCEKGILKIGSDFLPEGDFVFVKSIDTLSVFSYTMYDDSVRTDNPSQAYLGQIYDSYFGTTTAEFVTQIRLSPKWDGKPFTVDSVKLFLHLLTTKGRSDVVHTIKISEIFKQIYTDSAYYSKTPVPTTGFEVSNIVLPVLRTDTINDIFLKLPGNGIDFGNYLTRDTLMLFYSNTTPDFRSFFKGLYFQILPSSDPLLISLYLEPPNAANAVHAASQNAFVLYVHDDLDVQKVYSFILDATNRNAAYTRFSHNFNTALPGGKIQHINDGYKDTLSYLQNLNGVYTKVVLPGLESVKNDPSFGKIAVNKARLIVPVYFNGDQFKPSTVPPQLVLRYKTKSGTKYVVPDYSLASGIDVNHYFFDGRIDSTLNVYKFNIPAFVQAYLEDATDNIKPELEIYQGIGTRNVILKANKSKTPVKFEFTYTKF